MKVIIGFSSNKTSMLSKAIQLVEGSKYSHVYIRINSKYGEYVYQASGLSVNFTNFAFFKEHNDIVEEYEFDLDDEQKGKLLTFFIKHAGAKYQMSSLFKLLAISLGERVNIDVKFEGNGTKEFICSELGGVFCEEILGIDMPDDLDFFRPKDLNVIVKQYGTLRAQ